MLFDLQLIVIQILVNIVKYSIFKDKFAYFSYYINNCQITAITVGKKSKIVLMGNITHNISELSTVGK